MVTNGLNIKIGVSIGPFLRSFYWSFLKDVERAHFAFVTIQIILISSEILTIG